MGISDFTHMKALGITVDGQTFRSLALSLPLALVRLYSRQCRAERRKHSQASSIEKRLEAHS